MSNHVDIPPLPSRVATFHYFRIARETWELMLIRLVQLGLEAIMVPVPWNFHQPTPTTTDLTGITNARRNLLDFIHLCDHLNLWCVLHIGPYCRNQAILDDGVPHWVATNPDSLQAAAQDWYTALGQTLNPAQWPQGPIVALQLDSGEDDSTPSYPAHLTEVQWPIWLRKRYQGMEALNAAYETTYRSVSDVPFPTQSSEAPASLHKDVQAFLAEHADTFRGSYRQLWTQLGWQIPLYTISTPPAAAADVDAEWVKTPDAPYFVLPAPIQVEPDPPDITTGPVWAAEAPIRPDGSLRKRYWLLRQLLWAEHWPNAIVDGSIWSLSFTGGGIISATQDTEVKLPITKGSRPSIFRLRLTGEVVADDNFNVSRNQLRGHYVMEDEASQTDFVFYLEEPTAPLNQSLHTIFTRLLLGQSNALQECAQLASSVGQTLTIAPTEPKQDGPAPDQSSTPYTIAEARRGLQEAEAILKKAVSSIGGLESGFGTILDKRPKNKQATEAPLRISPEIFEGTTRNLLLAIGERCTQLASSLQAAAETIAEAVDGPVPSLTLDTYRQNYDLALTAANNAALPLTGTIAQLRREIAIEQLPLVTWQVHNQIQAIVAGLRWGVARGAGVWRKKA